MNDLRAGLLPLSLELYDSVKPEVRSKLAEFHGIITAELRRRGLRLTTSPICRLKGEVQAAVRSFERDTCDAIITLHLAYSPSLEAVDALSGTALPVIILDTTPSARFGPGQDPDELYFNHGIHGVQDLCSVLLRRRKQFRIEAGHWEKSDVLDRVAGAVRLARISTRLRRARVGRIGRPFDGMGDFVVSPDVLKRTLGVETVSADVDLIASLMATISEDAVTAEMADDKERYRMQGIDKEAHQATTKVGLAVRRWIEEEKLSAFTMNFLAFDGHRVPTVPFLEASKAMARGIGYAGEGDVLTAAFVGALASVYPDTTFTEMFCPDWEDNSVYLSHMGEMNLRAVHGTPQLMSQPFPFTAASAPVVAVGGFRGGAAVLANLAPGPEEQYTLVVAPGEMLHVDGENRMAASVHGWFRPLMHLADFLTAYSCAGGTHHSAMVYGASADEICRWGEMMGWRIVLLR